MGKVVGYVIAGLGLAAIIFGISSENLPFNLFGGLDSSSIMMGGVVLVVAGVVFALMKNKPTEEQAEKEVPIYAGEKIVGYRRQA